LRNNKICSSIIILALIFTLIFTGCSASYKDTKNENQNNSVSDSRIIENSGLMVHFLDVGQADSILIQTPDGKNMLIDAGNRDDGDFVVGYLKKNKVKKIDVVIGTHPHEDHIGAMAQVIRSFDVDKIYLPNTINNTKTFEDMLLAIKGKGLKINRAKGGMEIPFSNDAKVMVLAPNGEKYEDLNNYSVVVKITYKNNSFLFAGDAEKTSEEEMIKKGYDLHADVLKIGHHGSTSSTSQEFLKRVSPKYAVIMVGANNDYGHPHKKTLDLLKKNDIKIYRTDINGTIVMVSDGSSIKVYSER